LSGDLKMTNQSCA